MQMSVDRTLQIVKAADKLGFSIKINPSGTKNRCFYQCIAYELGFGEEHVIEMIQGYMAQHQVVPVKNKVQDIQGLRNWKGH